MFPWQIRQGIKETPLPTYKPLPECITIKKSPVHGLGLFATETIPEGTKLGLILIPDRMDDALDMEFIRTPLGGFGNHSDNPNCKKYYDIGGWHIQAIRDITPDEEITWTYTLYNPNKPIVP